VCSFTSDALAVAASGLVASEKNEEGKNEVAKTVVGLGLVLGIAQSTILYLLIHGGLFELFTNDTATLSSLRHIEPILVLCQPINSEGKWRCAPGWRAYGSVGVVWRIAGESRFCCTFGRDWRC